MSEQLIVPSHIADERIKADFKPFFRYATSRIQPKFRLDFEKYLVRWLTTIPKADFELIKVKFFDGKPPQKASLPKGAKNPRYLTAFGVQLACTMVETFQEHKKEPVSQLITLGG